MSSDHTFQSQNPPSTFDDADQSLAVKANSSYSKVDPERNDDASEKHDTPKLVGWDGPNDPTNPMNWATSIRVGHVVVVSAMTLIVYELV
jgi:hypothetical protein